MQVNISRAYDRHDDFSANVVTYNSSLQRFTTLFYVPKDSTVLRMPGKEQAEHFQVQMNFLAGLLATNLGLPKNVNTKIALYIEADFTTFDGDWWIIGKYRDGKMQLVHEKTKLGK